MEGAVGDYLFRDRLRFRGLTDLVVLVRSARDCRCGAATAEISFDAESERLILDPHRPDSCMKIFSILLLLFIALSSPSAQGAEPAPARTLWTNSVLIGTPEPLSPYTVERVFEKLDLKLPLYLAEEPGTDRLWVVLQGGEKDRPSRIVQFLNQPQTTEHTPVFALERRLIYGLTFHPGYVTNHFVFLFSNGPTGNDERTNRVSRFEVAHDGTARIDPTSEFEIISWRSAGHDGGDLAFGKDGMLYITAGDGTSDSDGWNSGQDISNLLATLIRIDVDHAPAGLRYIVPRDNPFIALAGARPEIWAYGFRNPWRMSIDRESGDIWVGNNGQDLWETAYLVHRGDNFGWSVTEGSHPFYAQRKRGPTPIVRPTVEHSHSDFRSLTGGVVYRGQKLPELAGTYVYGDFATGKIWGARHRDGRLVWNEELVDTTLQIAAFRNDQQGNLLIVDLGGGIYRLAKRAETQRTTEFPTKLSATGLFVSTQDLQAHPGLIPYEVNAPGWTDGAIAQRWIALSGSDRMQFADTRGWNFTNGSVLVQNLTLPSSPNTSKARRIETRILVRYENEWQGYSYRWNQDQSDALLVKADGEQIEIETTAPDGRAIRQPWRIPSRAECMACHSRAVNYVLGISTLQLNRDREGDEQSEKQLAYLNRIGAMTGFRDEQISKLGKLVNPYDEREDVDRRARSYLHANCSVCHVEAGGGNARMELEFTRQVEKMNLLGERPQHDALNLVNAMLVAPGDPSRSVLLERISRRGRGQMPPLVTSQVDRRAVDLIRRWIAGMKSESTVVQEWTTQDLLPELGRLAHGRSFAAGSSAFTRLGCVQCHRLGAQGGSVGPDLTGIAKRLTSPREILESILEPSKVIADGYASYEFVLKDGSEVSGQIEVEDADAVTLRGASGVESAMRLPKAEILRRRQQPLSNMPVGMVNSLKKDEILDLVAYLMADGKEDAPSFKGE